MSGVDRPTVHALLRWWINTPGIDLLLAAFVSLVAPAIIHLDRTAETRSAWLQTIVGVLAASTGFTITALSVILAVTPGRRLQSVITHAGVRFLSLVTTTLLTAFSTSIALAFLIGIETGRGVTHVEVLLTSLGIGAMVRVIALFHSLFLVLLYDRDL